MDIPALFQGFPALFKWTPKVDPEAVQMAEVEEVWGPAGKLEWGRDLWPRDAPPVAQKFQQLWRELRWTPS
jgi:hypothetical protein